MAVSARRGVAHLRRNEKFKAAIIPPCADSFPFVLRKPDSCHRAQLSPLILDVITDLGNFAVAYGTTTSDEKVGPQECSSRLVSYCGPSLVVKGPITNAVCAGQVEIQRANGTSNALRKNTQFRKRHI